jgi:hypothetical protein
MKLLLSIIKVILNSFEMESNLNVIYIVCITTSELMDDNYIF